MSKNKKKCPGQCNRLQGLSGGVIMAAAELGRLRQDVWKAELTVEEVFLYIVGRCHCAIYLYILI